jgi:hypothetical protein
MRKRRLTRAEEREYLDYARIMREEGIPLEIPSEWVKHAFPLDIAIAPPPDNQVFERDRGGLSYSVYVRLLSEDRLIVEHVAIATDWDDQIALEEFNRSYPIGMYGYPPLSWEEVLNSRIEKGLKFARPGQLAQGFILARGGTEFPKGYKTGQWVPFTLSLYDQYGNKVEKRGYLDVQRSARRARKLRLPAEDLFGNPIGHGITKPAISIVQTSRVEATHPPTVPAHLAGRFREAREGKIER